MSRSVFRPERYPTQSSIDSPMLDSCKEHGQASEGLELPRPVEPSALSAGTAHALCRIVTAVRSFMLPRLTHLPSLEHDPPTICCSLGNRHGPRLRTTLPAAWEVLVISSPQRRIFSALGRGGDSHWQGVLGPRTFLTRPSDTLMRRSLYDRGFTMRVRPRCLSNESPILVEIQQSHEILRKSFELARTKEILRLWRSSDANVLSGNTAFSDCPHPAEGIFEGLCTSMAET